MVLLKSNHHFLYVVVIIGVDYIPDGFPINGNQDTLDLVYPVINYLVCIDKIVICSIINALTLNILPIGNGHDYNSNVIVAPKGSGKTTFLNNFVYKGNEKNVKLTPAKHYESQIVTWDRSEFVNKTWVNLDAITLLMTLKNVQRGQLISFYTEMLSEGYYHRDKTEEIKGDMNVLFCMASESFFNLQKQLQDMTFFDRVVPIFFYPTKEEEKKIREKHNENRSSHDKIKIENILLPYVLDSKKYDFRITSELFEEIDKSSVKLSYDSLISQTRAIRYVTNFICSNAFINKRVRGDVVYPEISDIQLFNWLEDIHFVLDRNSLEAPIYNFLRSEPYPVTIKDIVNSPVVANFPDFKSMSFEIKKNLVRASIQRLIKRGMISHERFGGNPIYWYEKGW